MYKSYQYICVYLWYHHDVLLIIIQCLAIIVGAGSALLGKEGAMACTVAVEAVIGDHYNRYYRAHTHTDNYCS